MKLCKLGGLAGAAIISAKSFAALAICAALSASAEPRPWTHLNYQNAPGDFRFAIVPDRTGGDYRCAFTNALAKVNLMHPEFTITVGDLIQGGKTEKELVRQQTELTNMTAKVKGPFFTVVGNHDIGRSRAHPPGYEQSNELTTSVWRRYYGDETYYSFVYKGVLFVCLNTMEGRNRRKLQIGITAAQYAWFKKTLDDHPDVRWTLIFMHQPVEWTTDAWLKFEKEELLKRRYTVFAGDWHTYMHVKRHGRDYYLLSVAGGCSGGESRERLRGVKYGEMDHITWVTMTDDGPEVVNLLLDGILPGDYLTQATTLWAERTVLLDYPADPAVAERLLALKKARRLRDGLLPAVDPSRPARADLRTARVVCDVASKECVDAAAELRAALAMVAGKNEAEADGFVFAVGEVPPGETVSEAECRAKMSGGRLCFWGGASGRGTLAAVRGFLERKLGVRRTGPGIEDVEFVQQIEMPILEGEEWRFPQ